jgi:hypothetical protein
MAVRSPLEEERKMRRQLGLCLCLSACATKWHRSCFNICGAPSLGVLTRMDTKARYGCALPPSAVCTKNTCEGFHGCACPPSRPLRRNKLWICSRPRSSGSLPLPPSISTKTKTRTLQKKIERTLPACPPPASRKRTTRV